MKKTNTTILSFLLLTIPLSSYAETTEPDIEEVVIVSAPALDNAEYVKSKIQDLYPSLGVQDVIFIPPIGLYEVRTKYSEPLSYTNEEVSFFILDGELIDPKTGSNVAKIREIAKIQDFYRTLPFDESIQVTYGNGERGFAIFTDPDCPYCKETDINIHTQLTNDNITVSYFMNPLDLPGHDLAPEKAKKIWCAENKEHAWINWMTKGVLPNNSGNCENPVNKNIELAVENDFMVTPLIVFDNGIIWKGNISSEKIREVLGSYPVLTSSPP